MSLAVTVLVLLVANVFIRAHGNPVPPVAFTPKPNDLKGEGKHENARFKRMNDLLKKYLNGPTKKPGYWHYETCMGQPCSLKRI
uniref:Secreted protein n=1 Tax=Haemonchus contortus TaxID=6289 RepID=A0A7I4YVF8_HAECO